MKKYIALILALSMLPGFAGCSRKDTENTQGSTGGSSAAPASALEILQTVWDTYGEEEKFFSMGGSYDEDESKNNAVENAPGNYDLANAGMTATLLVPDDRLSSVDQAASLMHGMLANNFTCGAFHVTQDAEGFAKAVQKNMADNQWLCGAPERALVVTIGKDYVVAAFGSEDILSTWKQKLTAAYPHGKIIADEAITG